MIVIIIITTVEGGKISFVNFRCFHLTTSESRSDGFVNFSFDQKIQEFKKHILIISRSRESSPLKWNESECKPEF